MTERERGPTWDVERAHQDEGGGMANDAAPSVLGSMVERDEEAERRRFMAALERVMSDHRNVLAALAK